MPHVECDWCGEETYKRPSNLKNHNHKFCSRECHSEWRKENPKVYDIPHPSGEEHPRYNSIKLNCDECGKEFTRKKCEVEGKDNHFCSKECFHKWEKGKNFSYPKEGTLSRSNNPNWKGGKVKLTCEQCGEKFKVIPAKKETSKYCSKECYSEALKERVSGEGSYTWEGGPIIITCDNCGKRIERNKSWYQKQENHYCSQECYFKSSGQLPSSLEKIVIDVINDNNLPYKYVGDHKIYIGKLNPDFIHSEGDNKIIEVFGNYWHKNKEDIAFKDTEGGRKKYFSIFGYNTMVIWGNQIKNMSENDICNEIKSFRV